MATNFYNNLTFHSAKIYLMIDDLALRVLIIILYTPKICFSSKVALQAIGFSKVRFNCQSQEGYGVN